MNYNSIMDTSNDVKPGYQNERKAISINLNSSNQERLRMMSQKIDGSMGSIDHNHLQNGRFRKFNEVFVSNDGGKSPTCIKETKINTIELIIQQTTAILLVCMLNLMISIPFGVSYFPIEWRSSGESGGDDNSTNGGEFPLPGKEALGIRMFMFSTIIGQIVFALKSGFENGVGMQMVENVPFCHYLAYICINEQGYGIDTLSTLFFLFGFASVIVGIVFFTMGYFGFGRIVYFFPSHVLIGCIGGIGYFVIKVAIEVSMNANFSITLEGLRTFMNNFYLIRVVLFFEISLRILTRLTQSNGKQKYPLLSPLFYCAITPVFYFGLIIVGMTVEEAHNQNYFFPPLTDINYEDSSNGFASIFFNDDVYDIWRVIDFSKINWTAVVKCIPTLISLTAFSLIHVPINIPAFSISSGVEANMNTELKAHGYANFFAGLLGGLQNYLCYANSVLYTQSKGKGKTSGLIIAFLTTILFFVGPTIASFIPRCMAGTLLLHVGIDLFLEAVYDSYHKFDSLEYAGIWLITLVMSFYGMSAALVAGIIASLSVYAVQSITHQNPVRGAMCATTLRSSRFNRPPEARDILDDYEVGRRKIFVIQLHGHIFFGNVVAMTESIEEMLFEKHKNDDDVWIVILDFTLVLGIDSSAAHTISKLKKMMHRKFNISLVVFVTGSNNGFPCTYDLSRDLTWNSPTLIGSLTSHSDNEGNPNDSIYHDEEKPFLIGMSRSHTLQIPADYICSDLDKALIFSEDALVALQNQKLLDDPLKITSITDCKQELSQEDERNICFSYLSNLCPGESETTVKKLQSLMKRNVWKESHILWRQSSTSDCLHLLIKGELLSILEEESGTTEKIIPGAMLGELGLLSGMNRLSTVKVITHEAITMTLEKDVWEKSVFHDVDLARCLYSLCIRYMSHRLQHVSNRIFETRCLPV